MKVRQLIDSKGILVKDGDTIRHKDGSEIVISIEGDRFSFSREDGSKSPSLRMPKTQKKQKFKIIKSR